MRREIVNKHIHYCFQLTWLWQVNYKWNHSTLWSTASTGNSHQDFHFPSQVSGFEQLWVNHVKLKQKALLTSVWLEAVAGTFLKISTFLIENPHDMLTQGGSGRQEPLILLKIFGWNSQIFCKWLSRNYLYINIS